MKTTKEMIAVMAAFDRGEACESCRREDSQWRPMRSGSGPLWDWAKFDYRLAAKPLRGWYLLLNKGGESGFINPLRVPDQGEEIVYVRETLPPPYDSGPQRLCKRTVKVRLYRDGSCNRIFSLSEQEHRNLNSECPDDDPQCRWVSPIVEIGIDE